MKAFFNKVTIYKGKKVDPYVYFTITAGEKQAILSKGGFLVNTPYDRKGSRK